MAQIFLYYTGFPESPVTVDSLMTRFGSFAKWKDLGHALSLDDGALQHIFITTKPLELCLRKMFVMYMERTDLKHTWDEIDQAYRKVEDTKGNQNAFNHC